MLVNKEGSPARKIMLFYCYISLLINLLHSQSKSITEGERNMWKKKYIWNSTIMDKYRRYTVTQ